MYRPILLWAEINMGRNCYGPKCPGTTAPIGAVWSGSTLFAIEASEHFGRREKQTIFVVVSVLRVNAPGDWTRDSWVWAVTLILVTGMRVQGEWFSLSTTLCSAAVYVMCFFGTIILTTCIIKQLGHCIATWYAMSRSLVKLTEINTSWGVTRQWPNSWITFCYEQAHCCNALSSNDGSTSMHIIPRAFATGISYPVYGTATPVVWPKC